MSDLKILFAAAAIGFSTAVLAATHEVGQKNKQFSTDALTVKVGDSVNFVNNDPFFHNIFSLSEIATFDLGSYPQGESKSYTFETAGVVPVECAIHPNMQMTITVVE